MKTVLITGGSRGIGAATARLFAQQGYAVAIGYYRSAAAAQALAQEIGDAGGEAFAVQADVADPAQVQEMVDRVLEKYCQLDILICNAGISWVGLLGEMSDENWENVRGTNLDGVFYACRAVYAHMVRRHAGKILTVSSIWGKAGASCEAAYSAAKAGVIALTQALAQELGPSGITVNCVAPGVIDTEMNAAFSPEDRQELAAAAALGRLGSAEDVAQSLLFLASDAANFITGTVLSVDGGFQIGS